MTKEQFLSKLRTSLRKLPANEIEDIIQDFEEHFSIGFENGKTEEEISASLGNPQQIAKELVAAHHVEQVESTTTTSNILRAVWAVIGLGFFNLIIVLGPFLVLASLVLAGWIVSVAFTLALIPYLINVLIHPSIFDFYELFFAIGLSGAGLFIGIGMVYATRGFTHGLIRYLNYNIRVVKGGLKHG
ncbi:DUF1700 domain-containing protein [Oceanobacillus piezotolerans]|uniref:DUF1700 domain-containing protein n=1 Tax=Oceanobacillus piezotolerans TaxID=2448030 RepID=A0A498DGC3_9BACI|nr:DUF1700 domain-containing protein [Oceanobacillus piezotolerans]RLL43682.1 DUF1700 domain-containing protein [Oceanobacillus piezotolerans]